MGRCLVEIRRKATMFDRKVVMLKKFYNYVAKSDKSGHLEI